MPPSDRTRLLHMLDAAREAVTFASGRSVADLARDRLLTLALVKCVEIIGEAASKVSPETRREWDQIPWGDIVGPRNRLIHAYFEIGPERVCDPIASDLRPLIASLERAHGQSTTEPPASCVEQSLRLSRHTRGSPTSAPSAFFRHSANRLPPKPGHAVRE